MSLPQKNEYPPYYQPYIDVLGDQQGLINGLEMSLELFEKVLYNIEDSKQVYRYAAGKWTIKELVQHMIDTERVFIYRALRFSRLDEKPLPGFDENSYVTNYDCTNRDYKNLLDEFCLLRKANILMLKDFTDHQFKQIGTVEGQSISVRAIAFICSGHVLHHLKIIQERYL